MNPKRRYRELIDEHEAQEELLRYRRSLMFILEIAKANALVPEEAVRAIGNVAEQGLRPPEYQSEPVRGRSAAPVGSEVLAEVES